MEVNVPTVVTKTLIDRQYVESLRPLTIASSGHPIDLLYIYIYIYISLLVYAPIIML